MDNVQTFDEETVSAAHFAGWIDDKATSEGQTAEQTLLTLYDKALYDGPTGVGPIVLSEARERYAAGKRILEDAQLVIEEQDQPYIASKADKASTKRRYPNSAIIIMGGHRDGKTRTWHVGLKVRTEKRKRTRYEGQYKTEQVLAAGFAKRVMADADAQGWFVLDTLRSWYGTLEGGETLVAQMCEKYAKGRKVLQEARLVIGNRAPPGTAEAEAHRASVARRCPNSPIMSVVGGHRAGTECVRHIGLRTRKEKTPKS